MEAPADTQALAEVKAAFDRRREIASRLTGQDLYIGQVVRDARKQGHTWALIASAAGTSDVAVIKAARRPEKG